MLEVLTVMAILVLMAGSILAAYTPVSIWARIAWQETVAANHAFAVLECLRAQPSLLDEANNGSSPEELGLDWAPPASDWGSAFIEMTPRTECPNLYQVSVIVEWDQGDTVRDLRLDTWMRQEGR